MGEELQLNILPAPTVLSMRGAPFRPAPSNYLYVSTNATIQGRRKCHIFCELMQKAGMRTQMESTSQLQPTQAFFTASAQMPKGDWIHRTLRSESVGLEGYNLAVTAEGILLHGGGDAGLQYATWTLRQLMEDMPKNIPGMEMDDHPRLPYRAMHLDFKGWAPTAATLKRTIELMASVKINALILEYEAFFDFPSQPGLAAEGALKPHEVAEIELFAEDLGVMLIPLVPCIGNVAHLLKMPAYTAYREHPNYFQQFCAANPASLDIVTAMMEDLLAVHHGRYFHIGGDETRLLGVHPASAARAQQLGGRAALYLEYIGKVCRYLISRGRQPMLWDDMFRNMNDAQVKWLPEEVVLSFWQYEGHGGRATPAILINLDRYKKLGRKIWGAATRTPSTRYESFDNIDAWTEAGEMGYLEGLITTAWTRDHTLGGLFAPPETAWPAAFYAAQRMWGGRKCVSREGFPRQFVTRMFGPKDAQHQSRIWTGLDGLLREHPRRTREYLYGESQHIARNQETLTFVEMWAALAGIKEYIEQFDETVSSNYANLKAGKGDPFHCGRLRFRVLDLKRKIPILLAEFYKQARRLTPEHIIKEYVDSSLTYHVRRLDEIEALLQPYPIPEKEWQQPVGV